LIKESNSITTDIYRKPTDSRQYLHYTSNHPLHVKNNVPFTLAHRIVRIVSKQETVELRLNELKHILLALKYPISIITKCFEKALNQNIVIPRAMSEKIFKPVIITHNQYNVQYFNRVIQPFLNKLNAEEFDNKVNFQRVLRQPTNLAIYLNQPLNFSVKNVEKLCVKRVILLKSMRIQF
jgi:hypothetical protein